MLFREHKGSLDESLKTEVHFDTPSKEVLVEYINGLLAVYGNQKFALDDITIEFYCHDSRLHLYRDTYVVKAKDYGVVGFTNEMPT